MFVESVASFAVEMRKYFAFSAIELVHIIAIVFNFNHFVNIGSCVSIVATRTVAFCNLVSFVFF